MRAIASSYPGGFVMVVRHVAVPRIFLSVGITALIAGCAATPAAPTVGVMPGPGKAFATFQADNAACKEFATGQVQGQADASNQRAVGAALLTTVLGTGLGAAVGGAAGSAGAGAASARPPGQAVAPPWGQTTVRPIRRPYSSNTITSLPNACIQRATRSPVLRPSWQPRCRARRGCCSRSAGSGNAVGA